MYKDYSLNGLGTARINIRTGELLFVHMLTGSKNFTLPFPLKLAYCQKTSGLAPVWKTALDNKLISYNIDTGEGNYVNEYEETLNLSESYYIIENGQKVILSPSQWLSFPNRINDNDFVGGYKIITHDPAYKVAIDALNADSITYQVLIAGDDGLIYGYRVDFSEFNLHCVRFGTRNYLIDSAGNIIEAVTRISVAIYGLNTMNSTNFKYLHDNFSNSRVELDAGLGVLSYPDGKKVLFSYDDYGSIMKLLQVEDELGVGYRFEYNSALPTRINKLIPYSKLQKLSKAGAVAKEYTQDDDNVLNFLYQNDLGMVYLSPRNFVNSTSNQYYYIDSSDKNIATATFEHSSLKNITVSSKIGQVTYLVSNSFKENILQNAPSGQVLATGQTTFTADPIKLKNVKKLVFFGKYQIPTSALNITVNVESISGGFKSYSYTINSSSSFFAIPIVDNKDIKSKLPVTLPYNFNNDQLLSVSVTIDFGAETGIFANLSFSEEEYVIIDDQTINNSGNIILTDNSDDQLIQSFSSALLVREERINCYANQVTSYTYNHDEISTINDSFNYYEIHYEDDRQKKIEESYRISKNDYASVIATSDKYSRLKLINNELGGETRLLYQNESTGGYSPLISDIIYPNGQATNYILTNNESQMMITISADGSSNELLYQHNLLVEAKNQSCTYNYEYDSYLRLNKVLLGNTTYLTRKYTVNYVEDTYASNEKLLVGYLDETSNTAYTYLKYNDITFYTLNFDDKHQPKTLEEVSTANNSIVTTYTITKDAFTASSNLHNRTNVYTTAYDDLGKVTYNYYIIGDDSQKQAFIYNNNYEQTLKSTTVADFHQFIDYNHDKTINNIQLNNFLFKKFTYYQVNNKLTSLIQKETLYKLNGVMDKVLTYEYDVSGMIKAVSSDNGDRSEYQYDNKYQLATERKLVLGNVIYSKQYNYDVDGNITNVKDILAQTQIDYTYGANGRLATINGQAIQYNGLGNPILYKGNNLTWTRLKLLNSYGNVSFEYNGSGIRIAKKQGNKSNKYYVDGTRIIKEELENGKSIWYYYGVSGLLGFKYDNQEYIYQTNIFGDVIALIAKSNNEIVGRYTYTAYGQCTGEMNTEIEAINPFRYRSYYYDKETGLYWCTTRFYDPEIGRFISPDSFEYLQPYEINGLILYCYCYNNPINYCDPDGNIPIPLIFAAGVALFALLAGTSMAIISQSNSLSIPQYQINEFTVWFRDGLNNIGNNIGSFFNSIGNELSSFGNWIGGLFNLNLSISYYSENIAIAPILDYYMLIGKPHRSLRNGSKTRLRQKHTKRRAGGFEKKDSRMLYLKPPKKIWLLFIGELIRRLLGEYDCDQD